MTEDTVQPLSQGGLQQLLTGSILVTLASGVAYMTVYAYDLGASMHFNIPLEFISISVPNIIAVALVVLSLAYASPIAVAAVPTRFLKELGADWLVIPVLGIVAVSVVLIGIAGYPRLVVVFSAIGASLLWALVIVLTALGALGILKRKSRGRMPPVDHLSVFMPRQTAISVVGSILVLIFVATAAYAAGYTMAENRTAFAVTREAHPKVILAIYGDNAVAADYDPVGKTVASTFTIYKVGTTLPTFTITTVGRLTSIGPRL